MERACRVLITFAFVLLFAGNVWASTESFTTDTVNSSVSVSNTAPHGNVTGTLALPSETFDLADNATETFDFFTLATSGSAWNKPYDVQATLAFSNPIISGLGTGSGAFSTLYRVISYGTLTWGAEPSLITLPDGNVIQISFPALKGFFGNKVTIEASVTNLGGAPVPLPPSGLLLLSFGPIIVLGNACGKRSNRA